MASIFFTWFLIYLRTVRGLDLKSSSYYSMLLFLAMAAFTPMGGWLAGRITLRYGKRTGCCTLARLSLALVGAFIALTTQPSDVRLATFVLAGGAGASCFSISSLGFVTADVGGPAAGTVSGIMNMGNQASGAITVSLTPPIAVHFGWTASFLTAAVLCLLSALAWFFVRPEKALADSRLRRAVAQPAGVPSDRF